MSAAGGAAAAQTGADERGMATAGRGRVRRRRQQRGRRAGDGDGRPRPGAAAAPTERRPNEGWRRRPRAGAAAPPAKAYERRVVATALVGASAAPT